MHKLTGAITLGCLLLLGACASKQPVLEGDTKSLEGLQAMANSRQPVLGSGVNQNKLRLQAIEETALTIGAQSGLAYRAKAINQEMVLQKGLLERVYNFQALLLDNNILPPVLSEGRNLLNLANAQTIRLADRRYKILHQARFVTTAPNWRYYLWMDYKLPDRPNLTLLPKGDEEKKAWQQSIAKGWHSGIMQAESIFSNNVARLKQDYTGMILYRKLLAQNMVSPPFVSQTDLGVTGDADQVTIDDKVLRITALPALNIDSHQWKSALTKETDALVHFRHLETLASNTPIQISSQAFQPVISTIK